MAANSETFWDKAAAKYAEQPIRDQKAYEKKLEITRTYFKPESELLELGCGTGSTAILHAPHVKHIRATDISENMIAVGRQRAAEAGVDNITFERGSVDDIVAADESVDIVLALNIVHLLDDPKAAIAKIVRMLKPGGVLVSTTALLRELPIYFRAMIPLMQLVGKAPSVRSMSRDELRALMTDGGLTIDHDWTPLKSPTVFLVAKKPG